MMRVMNKNNLYGRAEAIERVILFVLCFRSVGMPNHGNCCDLHRSNVGSAYRQNRAIEQVLHQQLVQKNVAGTICDVVDWLNLKAPCMLNLAAMTRIDVIMCTHTYTSSSSFLGEMLLCSLLLLVYHE